MKIMHEGDLAISSDLELITAYLPLENTRILELGCGQATVTRQLAEKHPVAEIIATETDQIQHEKNLQITDLPTVRFQYGGAEAINQPDNSIDAVIMLKSLHHVPTSLMATGLAEIHRVLKPGGLAYFSEPVYAGEFNNILKLFHDEQKVRQAAFNTLKHAVESGLFELVEEFFFGTETQFQGFEEFEHRIISATHTEFDINDTLYQQVKSRFEQHLDENGKAEFLTPQRVDLLRKPNT